VQWDLTRRARRPEGGDNFQHFLSARLIVKPQGERFVAEGADFRNYTYVKYGRAVIGQSPPDAFQVFDQKVLHNLREEYGSARFTKAEDMTLEGLVAKLEIDVDGFVATIRAYNASTQDRRVQPGGQRTAGDAGITAAQVELGAGRSTRRRTWLCADDGHTSPSAASRSRGRSGHRLLSSFRIPGLFAAGSWWAGSSITTILEARTHGGRRLRAVAAARPPPRAGRGPKR